MRLLIERRLLAIEIKTKVDFDIINKSYDVIKLIGRGNNGEVYLIRHRMINEERVLKVIYKTEDYIESFYNELEALSRFEHESIPIIFDALKYEEYYFIIEEYIKGETLKEYIDSIKAKDLSKKKHEFIRIVISICEVILFIHSNKESEYLYLDIQPNNIIIKDQKPYLIDFGCSGRLENISKRDKSYGTIGFAAPEQYSGFELKKETDIYGIGALLYYMFTKRVYTRDIYSKEAIELLDLDIRTIIRKCLNDDYKERYSSANVLLRQLENIIYQKTKDVKSSLDINLFSLKPRSGVTNFAIAMGAFLKKQSYKAAYWDMQDKKVVESIKDFYNLEYNKGVINNWFCYMIPYYDDIVILEDEYDILLKDYGDYRKVLDENIVVDKEGINIFILGSKEWEIEDSLSFVEELKVQNDRRKNIYILFNMADNKLYQRISANITFRTFNIPYIDYRDLKKNEEFLKDITGIILQQEKANLRKNIIKKAFASRRNHLFLIIKKLFIST